MAKGVQLSERDAKRVQRVVRRVERDTLINRPRRRHKDRSDEAVEIRLAYCKTDAGAATVIDCYLDVDDPESDVIEVVCDIAGGGNLNSATPRLTISLIMPVVEIDDVWYSLFPFQATEDCECTPDPLSIDGGGTGAETAPAALENLGVGVTDSPTFAGATITAGLTADTTGLVVDGVNHRVGIGTANPGAKLEIRSSTSVLRLRDTGPIADATLAYVEFGGTEGAAWKRTGFVGDASSGNTDIYLQAEEGDLHLGDSSDPNVMTLQGGNVGIGLTTIDANYKLIIRRAANVNLGIGLIGNELAIAAFNDALSANIPMRFYASEYNLLNGNVGIGTDSPDTKLQVIGTASLGGAVNKTTTAANGTITQAGTAVANLGPTTVTGAIKSSTLLLSAVGPTNDLDVSGVNTVFVDTSGNNVTLGGTIGGVDGQTLNIIVHDATNNFTIENEEGTGNQDFVLHAGGDEVMTHEYGGWVFVCDGGDHWHDCSHAKHV